MKTKEEILKPYVETPFRHAQIVEKDNALLAMEQYANEILSDLKKGWISVKEQVPPDYQNVIFFDTRENTQTDLCIKIAYFVWSQTPVDYVTHWMPLPPNPSQP